MHRNANADAKLKKVKENQSMTIQIRLSTLDEGVQVSISDVSVPNPDQSLGKNMTALSSAVKSKKSVAIKLEQMLEENSKHLDERIKFMFRGAQGSTRQHA